MRAIYHHNLMVCVGSVFQFSAFFNFTFSFVSHKMVVTIFSCYIHTDGVPSIQLKLSALSYLFFFKFSQLIAEIFLKSS